MTAVPWLPAEEAASSRPLKTRDRPEGNRCPQSASMEIANSTKLFVNQKVSYHATSPHATADSQIISYKLNADNRQAQPKVFSKIRKWFFSYSAYTEGILLARNTLGSITAAAHKKPLQLKHEELSPAFS